MNKPLFGLMTFFVLINATTALALVNDQASTYDREELKKRMHETAKEAGRLAGDFKVFYSELKSAMEESGLEFSKASAGSGSFGKTDIQMSGKLVMVTCDLPGVKDSDLSIKLNDQLTVLISGTRNNDIGGSSATQLERFSGEFTRQVTLPVLVKNNDFDAKLSDGVLTIIFTKETKKSPKSVSIPIK